MILRHQDRLPSLSGLDESGRLHALIRLGSLDSGGRPARLDAFEELLDNIHIFCGPSHGDTEVRILMQKVGWTACPLSWSVADLAGEVTPDKIDCGREICVLRSHVLCRHLLAVEESGILMCAIQCARLGIERHCLGSVSEAEVDERKKEMHTTE